MPHWSLVLAGHSLAQHEHAAATIINFIVRGATNRAVADQLHLCQYPAKTQAHYVLTKPASVASPLGAPVPKHGPIVLHPPGPYHQSSGDGIALPAGRPWSYH